MAKKESDLSPIKRMIAHGAISDEQAKAFEELATLLILHERGSFVRTSRVLVIKRPVGPSDTDIGRQKARIAQIEDNFAEWQRECGTGAAITLDFARGEESLVAIARRYRMRFANGKKLLLAALDRWIRIKEEGITGIAPTGL